MKESYKKYESVDDYKTYEALFDVEEVDVPAIEAKCKDCDACKWQYSNYCLICEPVSVRIPETPQEIQKYNEYMAEHGQELFERGLEYWGIKSLLN